MNIAGAILNHARTRPDAPALVEGDRTIDYRELAGLIERTAALLAARGLARGDLIGVCLKDTAAHVVTLLAVARVGAVAVPLDWRARPAENARFVDGLGLGRVLAEPDSRLGTACNVVTLDAEWHRAVAVAETAPPPATEWSEPFIVSATSGSTGAPKFTMLSHLNYFFRIAGGFELMGLSGRHRYLSTSPLYYSGSRTRSIAHLLRGDCVILHTGLFTAAEYVDVANRRGATTGFVVPTVVRQLLSIAGGQPLLPGMAALGATGAPLHAEEKRRAARCLTPNFYEQYGAAETGVLSLLGAGDFAERADSVGRPHSLVEIEVVDEDYRILPVGAAGRLRCRGPSLGSPLPGQAGETARANFRNGWCYPGEIARLDELGYIFLHGRAADVIFRGGANIYPGEIESVLQEHPAVVEAAVIGYRTADNEEEAIAFVVAREALEPLALIAHCRMRLTPHKVPRAIRLVAQLPTGAAGKIDKVTLAEWLAANPPERA